MATFELANGLHEAEKNLYEDIDLYDYSNMQCHSTDRIFAAMRDDIVRYIFNA